jgi:hypothetical protein
VLTAALNKIVAIDLLKLKRDCAEVKLFFLHALIFGKIRRKSTIPKKDCGYGSGRIPDF